MRPSEVKRLMGLVDGLMDMSKLNGDSISKLTDHVERLMDEVAELKARVKKLEARTSMPPNHLQRY
jgi:cell division protein FtsB